MTKQNLNEINEIKTIIRENELTNIIIETGDENVFIPEENKFIVTKEFANDLSLFLFSCYSLKFVDMSKFDFSEVVSMNGCFFDCFNLKKVVLPENVTCSNLQSLKLCFTHNGSLEEIDFSTWKFLQVVDMDCAFLDCLNIKKIDLPVMNTINREHTFHNCEKLNKA